MPRIMPSGVDLENLIVDFVTDVDASSLLGDVDKAEEGNNDVKTCIPLVSEYTDCTPMNECTGCTKCGCSPSGQWDCRSIHQCDAFHTDKIDEELFDAALEKLEFELKTPNEATNRWKGGANQYTSQPAEKKNESDEVLELKIQNEATDRWKGGANHTPQHAEKKNESDELLDILNNYNARQKHERVSKRQKRSASKRNANEKRSAEKVVKKIKPTPISNNNHTVKFYSTVDELNEDTLKNSNISGTLNARRVEINTPVNASRRSNTDNNNKSLLIDFNQPKMYSHITDNKIDTDHENKIDSHEKQLNLIISNHTQKLKDKDLSKLLVNELKIGSEIIGDKLAPVTSNITFMAQNDTLTAMAFIAGNLLNKLWNMEKDASESSWETDDLKQEKISDLLDLFKEPLNLRQEAFLKTALQHLSSAINKNKDLKNVSICETIEEAKKFIDPSNSDDEENISNSPIITAQEQKLQRKNFGARRNKQDAAIKAISKINKVLGLIKKYEGVQKNLSLLKYGSDVQLDDPEKNKDLIREKLVTEALLTRDDKYSLNMFGNVLDKVTKLLLPKRSHKAMTAELKQNNLLGTDKDFKNHFKKMYGVDIENMTVTAKDKLVLDYIEHINRNPDCLMGKKSSSKALPVIEGNILLNLSEFFKMKSFADLVNMLNLEKKPNKKTSVDILTTTNTPVEFTTIGLKSEKNKKLTSTKEKLKSHLKSIIEDLMELQHAKGIKSKGSLRVADALPCIYNIMNAGKELLNKNNEQSNGHGRVVEIFSGLKHDMKMSQTRRSGSIMQIRPKSAVILERILQNFVEKSDLKTRRFLEVKMKPFDELKHIINKMKNVSSIYKNQALYAEVPAAEKLILLKALAEDVKNYIKALEQIKVAFQDVSQLSSEQFNELATFIVTSIKNITLNAQVLKKVDNMETRKHFIDLVNSDMPTLPKKPISMLRVDQDNGEDNNLIVSRYQIINHLIRNRMNIYMKLKEAQEFDVENDMNYNIAKKVIFYMDHGNINLAHELFKALMEQKQDSFSIAAGNEYRRAMTMSTPKMPEMLNIPIHHDGISHIKPLIQFQEPKIPGDQMKWMNQDHLIKQLLNIKNMGL